MTTDPPERRGSTAFRRIQDIFAQAFELEAGAREDFLARECGADVELRKEVESLLRSQPAEDFLAPPPLHLAEKMVGEVHREHPIGVRVGSYIIESLIASGGMSHVYSAKRTDGRFELEVAMKVLKRGMDTEEILRRFQLEQQALALLNHPSISRLLDAGTLLDGRPYFVMERVYGLPITTYCDRHRLSVGKRLELFETVCEGVQYAHQRLLVHRDLKPSNILVTETGDPKLLDFGIAKLLSPDSPFSTTDLSQSRRHPMTVAYASPEQLTNDSITTATDVYSLGVLLHEMVTGRRPFANVRPGSAEHREAIRSQLPQRASRVIDLPDRCYLDHGTSPVLLEPEQVSRARRMSRSVLRRELRGDLDNILLTALNADQKLRYASVEQFSSDLRRHRDGRPVLARRDTVGYRVTKFLLRNKIAVSIATIFVLTLLSGTVLSITGFQQARAERDATLAATSDRLSVLEFVESMFSPELYPKDPRRVSLVEILASAVERLETEPIDDEITRARLEVTVAKLCARNGLHRDADRLFEKALATQERLVGENSVSVANSCHSIALHHRLTGRLESSLAYARRSVRIYRQERTSPDPLLNASLADLGATLTLLGRHDEATSVLEEVIALAGSENADDPDALVHSLNNLALIKLANGDLVAGEKLFTEARSYTDHNEGSFGILLNNMAKLRFLERRFLDAEELVSRALAIQRKHFPYPHQDIAMSLNNLALIALTNGDLPRAERTMQEALEIFSSLYGPTHPRVADTLFNLGKVLIKKGDPEGGRDAYSKSLRAIEETSGPDHPRCGLIRTLIAEIETP